MSTSPVFRSSAALESGGGVWSKLLHLSEPVLQYVECKDVTPRPGRWEHAEPGAWYYSDGAMRLQAALDGSLARGENVAHLLKLRATALHLVAIQNCAILLEARCADPPWIIDPCMRWRQLRGTITSNEWTPFVLRWRPDGGRVMELRATRGTPAGRLDWHRGRFRIHVAFDAAALHPRWTFVDGRRYSTASPPRPAGWQATIPLLLRTVDDLALAPAVAGRFPGGREAAFTITDHCDFDAIETLERFLDGGRGQRGWLGRGLRLTKGVFTTESKATTRLAAPTLQNPRYRSLVRRLHDEGSEIAPHGLNERGNLEPKRFRQALDEIVSLFSPRTWIDHGSTLDYCFSMGGADNPEYQLLKELRSRGVSTLWAYHDAPASSVASLNLLDLTHSDLPSVVQHMGRHMMQGNPLVAAHFGRSALLVRTTGRVHDMMGRAMSTARRQYVARTVEGQPPLLAAAAVPWAVLTQSLPRRANGSASPRDQEVPFTRDDVMEMVPTVYPVRAVPLSHSADDDILLFATTEVLHTADAYNSNALARLISECGLHIAHSYLLNRLPYIAGIFASPECEALSPGWLDMLQAVSDATAARRLWNPPVSELAEWARDWQRLTMLPISEHAVEIHNPLAAVVSDFTVLLPATVDASAVRWGDARPAGTRSWGSWTSVWGELRPRRDTVVRWD